MKPSELLKNCLIIFIISLTGCSIVNEFYDKHDVFIERRNGEVGRNIHEVIDTYTPGTNPIIKDINAELKEYQFKNDYHQCSYALIVDSHTNEIKDWKFISNGSLCKSDKFYSGPW